MQPSQQLEVFTELRASILRITISGWLSHDTVTELNEALESHGQSAIGAVCDLREAVITLQPTDVHLFTTLVGCPLVYIALPEQAHIVQPLINQRRKQGFIRAISHSLRGASDWLSISLHPGTQTPIQTYAAYQHPRLVTE